MCIIIHKPAGISIPTDTLRICWERNPDGGGFCFTQNNKIQIYKSMSFSSFLRHFHRAQGKEMLIHFRYATHGKVNIENCHPFYVGNGHKLAFCHNGVFHNLPVSDKYSDTIMFNRLILQHLPDGFLQNPAILKLLEEYSKSSKLAFMGADGKVVIINRHLGLEDGGCWYSNTDYKPVDVAAAAALCYKCFYHTVPRWGDVCPKCARQILKLAF